MYIESLVKRNTCGLLVPITANEARTLSDTPPVAHASSLTTYGLSASGIYGHVKPAESLPLSNSGIGSVGVAVSIFARADHRHPEITSVLQASRLVRGSLVGLGGGVIAPAVEFTGESDLILDITHVNADYLVGLVPVDVLPVGPGSDEIAAGNHTHLYAGSATAGGPATTALACTGNAATATKLSTARTISLSGSVTGSVSFDGSGDVSISTTTNHTHSYLPLSGGTLTGGLSGTTGSFSGSLSATSGKFNAYGTDEGGTFISAPGGGRFVTQTSSYTGYIKITLPVSWSSTMIRFVVDLFNYSGGSSASYFISGYNYNSTNPNWVNYKAYSIGSSYSSLANLKVHFGHDGEKCCIYLGESNTSYSYPQIAVRDILVGFSSYSYATWSTGWNIGITTELGTITGTVTNPNVAYSVRSASQLDAARDFSISGGATAAAISFNGTGNVALNVTSLAASYLTGAVPIECLPVGTESTQVSRGDHLHDSVYLRRDGTVAMTGTLSGTTGSFSSSVSAASFSGVGSSLTSLNASNISSGVLPIFAKNFSVYDVAAYNKRGTPVFESSVDGSTWTVVSGSMDLFYMKQRSGTPIQINDSNPYVRVTWEKCFSWAVITSFVIGVRYTSPSATVSAKLYSSADGSSWTLRGSLIALPVQKETTIPCTSNSGNGYIRILFERTNESGSLNICSIRLLSSRCGDQGGSDAQSLIYSVSSVNNEVTFPAGLTATTFTGALSGNAATATKLATPRTISLSGSVTGSVSFDGSGDVSITTTTNHTHSYSDVGAASSGHTHLYAGSATAGGPATTAVTATNISGGTVSCTTLSASSTSSLVGNVGIGTSSIINSKLYVFLDKSISPSGSYYGQYNNAKFSTSIASGTRHGTGLYCLTEATGGTLTKLNCIDSKIIIASGSTAEDTFGICTSLFLDGGSTGTYYGLYMGREGTSTPDTYNYGIYQADSEATNIFKGYCRFEGGTNIDGGAGGRVRNFRVMSGTGTINHVKGTDTLVLYSNDGEYGSLGNKTLTLPLGSNNVETGDLIWVYFCGGDTLFFTTSTPNKIKKFTYDSNAQNFIMSTWRNEGSFPVIIHCLWDGEFWRLSYCALGI